MKILPSALKRCEDEVKVEIELMQQISVLKGSLILGSKAIKLDILEDDVNK